MRESRLDAVSTTGIILLAAHERRRSRPSHLGTRCGRPAVQRCADQRRSRAAPSRRRAAAGRFPRSQYLGDSRPARHPAGAAARRIGTAWPPRAFRVAARGPGVHASAGAQRAGRHASRARVGGAAAPGFCAGRRASVAEGRTRRVRVVQFDPRPVPAADHALHRHEITCPRGVARRGAHGGHLRAPCRDRGPAAAGGRRADGGGRSARASRSNGRRR